MRHQAGKAAEPTSDELRPPPEKVAGPASGTFAAPDVKYVDVPPSTARPHADQPSTQHTEAKAPRPPGRDGVPTVLRPLYDLRYWAIAFVVTSPALVWPLAWLVVASVVAAVVAILSGQGFGAVRSFGRLLVSLLIGALAGLVVVAIIAGAIAALQSVGKDGLLVYAHAKVAATHWGLRWGTFLGAVWTIRRAIAAGIFGRFAGWLREAAPVIVAAAIAAAVVTTVLFAQGAMRWASPLAAINPGLQRSVSAQLAKLTRLTATSELSDKICTDLSTTVTRTDTQLVVTVAQRPAATQVVALAAVVHNQINPFVRTVLIRTQGGRGPSYLLDNYALGSRTVADNPTQVSAALHPVGSAPRVAGGARKGFGARC